MSNWYLYMVQTASGHLYTGISTDPMRRLRQHRGEITGGAKALRGKGPLTLVFQQSLPDKSSAAKAEYQLKQLPRSAKLALVADYNQSESDG
ncbi:MAG TPA: GIY-YIG nuclease family protein [Rheinheimera sp.]|uniref:GIY-YIG nuclease family protein n=1 Tax=Rheinheimera sp. TaxID=1869214 RepID=UPI002F930199